MSHSTNESEDDFLCKDQSDSQSFDEGSCGGSFGGRGGGAVLKKGPWTSAEDAILVDYVKKHGEGNWNAVQKHSGLFRCGKSCRLRWANHLRPNLKKGAFTADEERKIVELHAKMGNKWARMAAHLPGRTDNEIKNYWNTRIKRRQRAGLPLYPPDVDFSSLNGSHQIPNSTEFNNEDARHHGFLRGNGFEIPDVMFDSLKANHGVLSCNPPLPGISVGGMLAQGLGSSLNYGFMPTTMRRPKRLRESENLFSGFNGSFTNKVSPFDHFQSDTCEKIQRPFALSFPYEPDRKVKNPPPYGAIPGSHALINGNTSTSKPNPGAVKLELPSFQYPETDLGSWETSPLLPSLESFDTVTPSLSSEQVQSNCVSPRNSGLLEALLHESQTLNNAKNQSSDKSPSSSVVTPSDMMDGTNLNLCEAEWENFSNPVSPSVFSECNPINRSSLDEAPPAKPMPGSNVKQESVEHTPVRSVAEKEAPTQLDFSRPDAVLGAGWFGRSFSSYGEDLRMNETSSNQAWGLGFIQWNNMPGFRQISGLP